MRYQDFRRRATAPMCLLLVVGMLLSTAFALPVRAATQNSKEVDYMNLKNLNGPSGVALGGIGVGYYEISPT